MKTIVVGRASNLTQRLALVLPEADVVSARSMRKDRGLGPLASVPFKLVLNNFQPADSLNDLDDPEQYIELSISLTAQILSMLPASKCTKVIYTSSASVYGDSVLCREDASPRASSLPAALKLANENLVADFCTAKGINFTVARVFNMYGGEDRFSVVRKLLDASQNGNTIDLNNRGSAVRDFIHVDDVASAYSVLLDLQDVPLINVATGVGVSVSEILNVVARNGRPLRTHAVERSEIPESVADVKLLSTCMDISNFRSVLHYVSEVAR